MIVKDLDDSFVATDALARAGRAAEEQMAYYLRRAFRQDEKVDIFNGLRLKLDGDAAQIDHLALHSYGLIIVESKSVTTKIRINAHQEWARLFNGSWKGLPSPILQAERQADFLRAYLQKHKVIDRNRLVSLLGGPNPNTMPIDVIVAISDSGVIERPNGFAEGQVVKADQVTDRIRAIVGRYDAAHRKAMSLLRFGHADEPFGFLRWEYPKVRDFLAAQHKPLDMVAHVHVGGYVPRLAGDALPAQPESVARSAKTAPTCRHCKSVDLTVQYGRHGYYFRCLQCRGTAPINVTCVACRSSGKIRKDGQRFYVACTLCNRSTLFYTNRPESGEHAATGR